jgi:hypothetical protein
MSLKRGLKSGMSAVGVGRHVYWCHSVFMYLKKHQYRASSFEHRN